MHRTPDHEPTARPCTEHPTKQTRDYVLCCCRFRFPEPASRASRFRSTSCSGQDDRVRRVGELLSGVCTRGLRPDLQILIYFGLVFLNFNRKLFHGPFKKIDTPSIYLQPEQKQVLSAFLRPRLKKGTTESFPRLRRNSHQSKSLFGGPIQL